MQGRFSLKKSNMNKRDVGEYNLAFNDISNAENVAQDRFCYPVVGISASARELSALENFFGGMPSDSNPGMAFVLVQHSALDNMSIVADVIRGYTRMQVFEAIEGMNIEVNCVYLCPPGCAMEILDRCFHLLAPMVSPSHRLPINTFFCSLARELKEQAIAIILSGLGCDGSLGVREIKAAGGMVMVQSPRSFQHDRMSISAIGPELVDFQLTPVEMATSLISYNISTFGNGDIDSRNPNRTAALLKEVFILLKNQSGHDFSQYKASTIMRRIERRMAFHQIASLETYLSYMQQENSEADLLFHDLLIGVTNFFRDPDAFAVLENQFIPKLFENKKSGAAIRVWCPGCSTGEEAYSLAILLVEYMEKLNQRFLLQVFATDIEFTAITTARAAVYPASIAADISPDRLARFFTIETESADGSPQAYRISKSIRDILIFSEQDVIKDPPFSSLDLISCRNLMIYLGSKLQKRLIPLFSYALNPHGLLFLGASESIGEHVELFVVLDRKAKIYQNKHSVAHGQGLRQRAFPMPALRGETAMASSKKLEHKRPEHKEPLREIVEQTFLKKLAPSGALVNSQGDIFYLQGRTGMYLEPATGVVGAYNILKMAREGLKLDLTTALFKAVQNKSSIYCPGLLVKTNGHFTPVDLSICPAETVIGGSNLPELYLVILQEGKLCERDLKGSGADYLEGSSEDVVAALKRELVAKEEYLQSANEELETSNEELKTSNEEMQSINEELQSTNEELETSKEELQSVNEELATVNAELQAKVLDLSMVNNDMNNLLSGTGIATVFVDFQLKILRYTPAVKEIINLEKGDVGRPINHFVINLVGYASLIEDIQSVFNTLVSKEIDVQTAAGKWFTLRILPYRTINNVIEGAVITFVDITERKQSEERIKAVLAEKELILKEVNHRIKNNMHSMKSMLMLQAAKITDSSVVSVLEDAGKRMQSMEILYDKLYQSANFSELSINAYLPSLVDAIISNYPYGDSVIVEKSIDDFTLDAKRLQLLGIIVNELLTNIMKYAFRDVTKGVITVSVKLCEEQVTVNVQDNGVGIPLPVFSDNSSNFGLTMVNVLAEQLNATIRIECNGGSRIILSFKL